MKKNNKKSKKNNKNSMLIVAIMLVLALVAGGTYAYWGWRGNIVNYDVTIDTGGMGLTLDGGMGTVKAMAPALCTDSTYANKYAVNIKKYNTTNFAGTTTLTLNLTSFTYTHNKPDSTQLGNIKVALTTSSSSCANPLASGTFASATVSSSAGAAATQTTPIFNWTYTLPAMTGTASNMDTDSTYYLYVWLDSGYEYWNEGSGVITDPLQDITFNLGWSASTIQQG